MKDANWYDGVPETHWDSFAVYQEGLKIEMEFCFYGAIMAAIRMADSDNAAMLKRAFPEVYKTLALRYSAPGGCLTVDELVRYRDVEPPFAEIAIGAFRHQQEE